ncbi:uncharacterized protein N7469_005608 [Penicillium citrinum]|uniref:Uncharacterized protein n=2 Tax=Penicillium TaxID=5073 RepID=A0A9W9TPH0_PENCI|nr:uncharacterized protein N7469_005608 [Penicillium citrinum]KAJ5233842.1 hypothetical protein N7469_005608 [Penicillium citrinum]KAJ5572691.1 hypothetical protein N7450_009675 [Penicillium hetheringtonii]
MYLSIPTILTTLVLGTTVSALPGSPASDLQERDAKKYTNWQLRLFSEATPVCNPDESNVQYSVFTRSGYLPRACESFGAEDTEDGVLPKSLSFKSVSDEDPKDFCMFSTTNCSTGSLIDTITSRWEVCYPYNGFVGFSVVPAGTSCV